MVARGTRQAERDRNGGRAVAIGCAVLILLFWLASGAFAHAPDSDAGQFVWWSVDPWSALLLGVSAWWYARGRRIGRRRMRRTGRSRPSRDAVLFWSGWASLAIALGPPIDPLGGELFTMHMVQHEILMLIAAPLLVLSRPAGHLLWGMPAALRRGFARLNRVSALRRAGTWTLSPLGAWTLHMVVLWAWHVPRLFEASLASDAVHALQHASFFGSALLFWGALLIRRDRARDAIAVLYLFTTAMHSGTLGALLTFAPTPWYTSYQDSTLKYGLTALEDQQLGGLLMWVPSGLVFLTAALVVAARCLRDDSVKFDLPRR